ncbi:hypothetical protein NZK32_07415 [Cyanobium sp. FGCU-52]|nr:hypothetical protein [Cyanobium sp. FGCU52]
MLWLRRAIRTAVALLADPLHDPRPASRLIRATARKQWLRLVVNLLLSLIQAGAEGATLGVVYLAVDLLSQSQSSQALGQNWSGNHLLSFVPGLTQVIGGLPIGTLFIILLSMAVLLRLIQSLSMYVSSVVVGDFGARVNAEVTGLIHHQIMQFTLACASRYPVGELTYYAGVGPGAVMSQINIASSFIVNGLMVMVYLIVLISLSLLGCLLLQRCWRLYSSFCSESCCRGFAVALVSSSVLELQSVLKLPKIFKPSDFCARLVSSMPQIRPYSSK